MNKKLAAALVGAFFIAAGPLLAADAAKGEKVFNKFKACYVVKKTKNKVGPHLKGSSVARPPVLKPISIPTR